MAKKKTNLPRGIIRRKPGGNLHIRWKDEHGKDVKMSTGSTSITDAKALLTKKKEQVRLRKLGLAPSAKEEVRLGLTVAALIERYRSTYESKTDPTPYLGYMKRWKKTFGNPLASQVVPGDIDQWRRDMSHLGLSNATINRHTSFLRALYNLAIRDRLLETNPLAKGRLKKLSENDSRDRVISRGEEAVILGALSPVDRAAFIICLYSGIRQGEMLNIRRNDVCFDSDRLKLPKTKAQKA